MPKFFDAPAQLELLAEGAVDLISAAELKQKIETSLKEKKPLRIKYGADPSSPDLHLGHTVPLRKLRLFQDLGHKVVFIVGDFTARVGDPSQRNETRPMLSKEQVAENAKTYTQQVLKVLDASPERLEIRHNSEWLDVMTPGDFLHLTAQYTVARLLERDDFQKRYASHQPIAVIEFLYPLLQGYDSVRVQSDLELGGSDQKFNLLVGRELQKVWGQSPQCVMTLPIIEGTDGVKKMSKSYGNSIAIHESPTDMFGKVMRIPDELLERYLQYVSGWTREEWTRVRKSNDNPRYVKAALAERIVSLFHSEVEGVQAREEFDRVHRDKGLPDEIPTVLLPAKTLDIVSLLKDAQLAASKGEARRLVEQGGVRVNQEKISDPAKVLDLSTELLVQCGKRKFAKVKYGA